MTSTLRDSLKMAIALLVLMSPTASFAVDLVCVNQSGLVYRNMTVSAISLLQCRDILIDNVRVTGPGAHLGGGGPDGGRGIEILQSQFVTVRDSVMTNATTGIYIQNSTDVRITGNLLFSNGSPSAGNTADILVWQGDNRRIHIVGNEARSSDVAFGIALFDTYDFEVRENFVSNVVGNGLNSGYGILAYSTDPMNFNTRKGWIVGNRVSDTGALSIYLAGANDLIVAQNITARWTCLAWLPCLPIVVNGGINNLLRDNLVPVFY